MDLLQRVFQAEGAHLFWGRVSDDHVAGGASGEPFVADRSYVVIRLAEMYLGRTRTLWRKFSPLVHSYVSYEAGHREETAVAGPGQIQELGEANLDRVIVFNTRLAGPTPYRGGDVSVLAGLYSVPREDAAAALVETVGALAGVAGGAAATAAELGRLVKTGVDNILKLGQTRLQLGVRDTFSTTNPLRVGFHVGIGAPQDQIDVGRLWIRDGRLVAGENPVVGQPYGGNDYFVVRLEAPDRRADWPGLPGMADFEKRFSDILKDPATDAAGKRAALGREWPAFTEALTRSDRLTRYDAGQIANDVLSDLKGRVDAIGGGNPFETRSWGSDATTTKPAAQLDFVDIPEYGDRRPETGEDALSPAAFASG